MPNQRVSGLAPLTAAQLQGVDLLLVSDVNAQQSKKLSIDDLETYLLGNGFSGSVMGSASYATNALTASYAIRSGTASYATSAGSSFNSLNAQLASTASAAGFAISSSYSSTASYALNINYSSASFAINAINSVNSVSASYLNYNIGASNGTSSYSVAGLSSSFATISEATVSSSLSVSSSSSATASFAANVSSASFANTAIFALTASVGITNNVVTSASFASASLSSSYSTVAATALNTATASFLAPNSQYFPLGIYLAITQSRLISQLDSVNIITPPQTLSTSSIEAIGNIVAHYTASMPLNESISLVSLNRNTGVSQILDTTPIYNNVSPIASTWDTLATGSFKIPFTLAGNTTFTSGSYLIYVSASSNTPSSSIHFETARVSRFNINGNYITSLTATTGQPLVLTTASPTDQIIFSSSMGGPYVNTAANIATSSAIITMIDISSVSGIQYVWTLPILNKLISTNNISVMDVGGMPASIISMSLQGGNLSSLADLSYTSASYLNCSNNRIVSMGGLPVSMSYINLSNNLLTSLPSLPNGLLELRGDNLNLINIPLQFPNSIVTMSFNNNPILTNWLTTLPSSLTYFSCNNNTSLTTLPTIPSGVVYLDVSNCNLSNYPVQYNIVSNLVGSGKSNGTLLMSGNQSISGDISIEVYVSVLLSRGWTVTYS